jgi:hypothetical protein
MFNRLLKNSVHPSTELRANGISLEITSKYPFMLSQVEACKLFFNNLLNIELLNPELAIMLRPISAKGRISLGLSLLQVNNAGRE